MPRGLKPLHTILALTRWPMRVLTAVIEIATLAMFNAWENLALRRAVALQFIDTGGSPCLYDRGEYAIPVKNAIELPPR
jgi:hypothetical protein